MDSRISSTRAAREFSDLLNRVKYRGEHFVIERGGEPVADLVPHEAPRSPLTLAGFFELLKSAPKPDPDFWTDLEDIRANQPPMPEDPWESS